NYTASPAIPRRNQRMSTAAMPEPAALPEEVLYEVANGQEVERAALSPELLGIASHIVRSLSAFVAESRTGTALTGASFALDRARDLRRRPDVAFVSADRWPLDRPILMNESWPMTPDLAIEVIRPSDRFVTVMDRVTEYFDHGVREVWLVAA